MNDDATPQIPEPQKTIEVPRVAIRASKPPLSYWLKRLLACNPFYLVSAALLLYGCYRISTDPGVLQKDHLHLFFNFSSIQLYELLLVGTAIFLAGRRIWYDSTLLVGLENLLLIVPFILISQGALIGESLMEQPLMLKLCAGAGILAAVRLAGLKRFIGKLNFDRRALFIALGFLAVNVALPVVYRTLHESKVGTHLESGAAFYTNELVWMVLLPGLCALASLVPIATQKSQLWPERWWLPAGMFGLWLVGTGVHVYCLGYVYDFSLRAELVAPALWVLLWMLRLRAPNVQPKLGLVPDAVLLVGPLLATGMAISSEGTRVFLSLTLINVVIYGVLGLMRGNRPAPHLLLISLAALVAGFPMNWGQKIFPGFSRAECVWGAVAAYVLVWALRSKNPVLGIFGGLIVAVVTGMGLGDHPNTIHWAIQAGLVFLLVNSLRWEDAKHPGARGLRVLASAIWAAHALLWMHTSGAGWMACCAALPALAAFLARRFAMGAWGPLVIPIAAILVILSGPADATAIKAQTASMGVLAMVGSFLLFGAGTVAALAKHRRHKAELTSG